MCDIQMQLNTVLMFNFKFQQLWNQINMFRLKHFRYLPIDICDAILEKPKMASSELSGVHAHTG